VETCIFMVLSQRMGIERFRGHGLLPSLKIGFQPRNEMSGQLCFMLCILSQLASGSPFTPPPLPLGTKVQMRYSRFAGPEHHISSDPSPKP